MFYLCIERKFTKMKQHLYYLFIVFLFIASFDSYSQGLEISVYTEPQITWISSDESYVQQDGTSLKLNTGIEFDAYFMPNYAFSFGLNLNNQGGRLTYSDSTVILMENQENTIPPGVSVQHNYQYAGIPLGLKLKTEELGYTTIYFHGGVMPMLNIKSNASSSQISIVKENISPEINFFNLNYFAEIGMQYRLAGNTAIIAGLKWSSGFNDVTKSDLANNNLNSVGLHLGILF